MNEYLEERNQKGFTLIELLVAIVVVGILTAVAIVGIAGLTDTAKGATCSATLDSSRAAVAAYYAAHNSPTGATYPTTFDQMLNDTPNPELTKPPTVLNPGAGNTLTDNSTPVKWTITLGANGALSAAGTDAANCT